jgi:hypothetical protein
VRVYVKFCDIPVKTVVSGSSMFTCTCGIGLVSSPCVPLLRCSTPSVNSDVNANGSSPI